MSLFHYFKSYSENSFLPKRLVYAEGKNVPKTLGEKFGAEKAKEIKENLQELDEEGITLLRNKITNELKENLTTEEKDDLEAIKNNLNRNASILNQKYEALSTDTLEKLEDILDGDNIIEEAGAVAEEGYEAVKEAGEDVADWLKGAFIDIKDFLTGAEKEKISMKEKEKMLGTLKGVDDHMKKIQESDKATKEEKNIAEKYAEWYTSTKAGKTIVDTTVDAANFIGDLWESLKGAIPELEKMEKDIKGIISKREAKEKKVEFESNTKIEKQIGEYGKNLTTLENFGLKLPAKDADEKEKEDYFNALNKRIDDVRKHFEKLGKDMKDLNSLNDKQKKRIRDLTDKALGPMANAIDDPKNELRDEKKWEETVTNYSNLIALLPEYTGKEMKAKEEKKYLGGLLKRLEETTGLKTLDLDKIDKSSNPFLYILSMIAKAFGASFHVDKNNAIVGWSGKNNPEAFVKIASDIVEQKAMIAMFEENEITNSGVKQGLNKVLFNPKCLPAGSVAEIKKASGLREEFIRKIGEMEKSEEMNKKIVKAMDFLNKNPLQIVGSGDFSAPGKMLSISSVQAFVVNPDSFGGKEKKE